MKTIEERAEIWSDNREAYCLSAPMLMKESYFQGAVDQKKIDIEIDEDKLDELALEYVNKQWCTKYKSLSEITNDLDECAVEDFKAGFRKAKELWHTRI